MSGRRVGALVALVLAALLGLGVSQASAAGLVLDAGLRPTVRTAARCTTQPVTVTTTPTGGTSAQVTVAGLDSGRCAGLPVSVSVYDPSVTTGWPAARRFTGTGTVSAGTLTVGASVAPTSFVPSASLKAYVTVNGWPVAATWSYTPPVVVGCQVRTNGSDAVDTTRTCTIGTVTHSGWNTYWRSLVVQVPMTFSSQPAANQYVTFTVAVPTADQPAWWSWSDAGVSSYNYGSGQGAITSSCSALPLVSGRTPSNVWGGFTGVSLQIDMTRGATPLCAVP